MPTTESTPLVKEEPVRSAGWRRWAVGAVGVVVLGGGIAWLATANSSSKSSTTPLFEASTFCDSARHEFDYIKLPNKVNDSYFYSFFESRSDPAKDPLIMWLEGGPGSSSTWALYNVNGPCTINDDLAGTTSNPYSWTTKANMLWLDQPTNVGFSHGDGRDDDHDEVDVGRNIYWFLQGWLKKHPEFLNRPFYIAGQSYGGHYVPAAAHYIVSQQNVTTLPPGVVRINLQGIAIGNGITDTEVQFSSSIDLVDAIAQEYNITLVTPEEKAVMEKSVGELNALVRKCQEPNQTQACINATQMWQVEFLTPLATNPDRNPYDVREVCAPTCNDYGMAKTGKFMNLPEVQKMFNAHKEYQWNNATVDEAFMADVAKSVVHMVPPILASGVRVMLYVGDADLMCDWKGNDAWAKQLKWPGQAAYNAAAVQDLLVDGKKSGEVRSSNGLSFIRVYNSGHGVPVDQPAVGLALLNRFISNSSLEK